MNLLGHAKAKKKTVVKTVGRNEYIRMSECKLVLLWFVCFKLNLENGMKKHFENMI